MNVGDCLGNTQEKHSKELLTQEKASKYENNQQEKHSISKFFTRKCSMYHFLENNMTIRMALQIKMTRVFIP